jgi:glycosyl transferase family 25
MTILLGFIIFFLILFIIYFLYRKNSSEYFNNLDLNLNDLAINVMNLKKDIKRKEIMKTQLDKYNLQYEIIEAVDGSLLDIEKLKQDKLIKITDSELKKGQYGCYLSHINIWKKFIESDKKYCLVLEDDVKLCEDFSYKLNNLIFDLNNLDLSDNENNIDMIYLIPDSSCNSFFQEEKCKKNIGSPPIRNTRKSVYLGYGMYGYIITRQGAEKLLKYGIPMIIPIDVLTHQLSYLNILNILKTIIPYVEHTGTYSNTENIVSESV